MQQLDRDSRHVLGGLIHTYQKYDPKNLPSPTQPPPDVTGIAFEHMLHYGSMRHLTDEDLANAIHIDPSQIAGLGPSLEALIAMLEDRKRKILETYETDQVLNESDRVYHSLAASMQPPREVADRFITAVRDQQIRDLERLWYKLDDERTRFATELLHLRDALGDKYQVEELASKYEFTGRTPMNVPKALEIKEELETIDKLLEQLREAMKNAKIGIIDLEKLAEFVEEADIDQLNNLNEQVQDFIREQAEMQGLDPGPEGYQLTPKAYKIFQSKLLDEIFSSLHASRSGRHSGPIAGDGAVELPKTKAYEFGDSAANMDVVQSMLNALVREGTKARRHEGTKGGKGSVRITPADIETHLTRNNPKCATAVLMDMSGSMRHDGQYVATKRMALAFDGLIRRDYPGDFLRFIEIYSFAKNRQSSELVELMPKPVTIRDPVVRLKVDMSREDVSESVIPPHFTNIQHGLRLARQQLGAQDTPNKQVILLTDGLPTAHFDGTWLYLLYPPDPLTEEATMREAMACAREGITINVFLLPNWWQSSEDIAFAHRMAEATGGRVFFTGGSDVDRFVLWDYVSMRRRIIG